MPPKATKDSQDTYHALKRDIAAGAIGRLYLFHGEEAYLRDHYLAQMKEKLIPEGLLSFNFHTLNGKACTPQALSDLIDGFPMMSERTMILVTDYDLFKAPEAERNAMTALLSDLPDYCCLVFLYDLIEYKGDARMKGLTALFKDTGRVVNFARQSQGDLTDWIHRRFRATGHHIDTADAQYLIFLCGDLMHGLIGEIEKVAAFSKNPRVTREDIDAVAIPQLDAVVFQMTDAITERNHAKAAGVLGDLLQMQEAPIMILAVLGKQVRQLYTARMAYDAGKSAEYLMGLWGMRSSYPAQKLMTAARRFGPQWCRRAVGRCAETDLALKSVTGIDGRDALTTLLLELFVEGSHGPAY